MLLPLSWVGLGTGLRKLFAPVYEEFVAAIPVLGIVLLLLAIILPFLIATPLRALPPSFHIGQDKQFRTGGKRPPHNAPIPASFQALIDHSASTWPSVPFTTLRLWCTDTTWKDLNPAQGIYDWTELDRWLAKGQEYRITYLLTIAMTPQWASSNPNDSMCKAGPGSCDPPNDLNPDGSGSDQHWKDFITAVATHVNGQIRHFEIWNEPYEKYSWNGTYAQLARMAQDARSVILSINPNAKLMNGGVEAHYEHALKWWRGYAAAGGLDYADIIALHGDVRTLPETCGVYPEAETFLKVMHNLNRVLRKYGQVHKPIWDTEASWGQTNGDCFTDQDLQSAFLARFFLLHRSFGIKRFYWRAWVDPHGGLFDYDTKKMFQAGVAYSVLHDWLIGNTLTGPCTASGTVWTCNFTGPNGYAAQAIWDTSQTCYGGKCGTQIYPVDPQFVDYIGLDGSKNQINDNSVPIGAKPIWLEN